MITAVAILMIVIGWIVFHVAVVFAEAGEHHTSFYTAVTGALLFVAGWGVLLFILLRWLIGWVP